MLKEPLISVICPTYGRVHFLEDAIYSFLQQSYSNKEMIIINDLQDQKLIFAHPQIKIFNLPERIPSLGEKKNLAANLASGDIIIPLDDDDILLPHYLETCFNFIGEYNYWMLPTKTFVYNEEQNVIQLSGNGPLNTFIYKKEVLNKNQYEHINFNINKSFILKTQRSFKGRVVKLPLNHIGYISRWDKNQKNSYHVRVIGLEENNDQKRYEKVKNSINHLLKLKFIPSGDVYLNPKQRYNYSLLVQNFIESLKNTNIY